MPSYRTVGPEVTALLTDVMTGYHLDLVEVGVTVQILAAHAKLDKYGLARGPALKHHGYPAAAIISITSLEDRVGGMADARIVLDGDRYPELTNDQKTALLDHELEHLELVRDADGQVELDDANRPRLKSRQHDAELGLFWSVVERHGEAALEVEQYKPVHKKMTQLLLPWG